MMNIYDYFSLPQTQRHVYWTNRIQVVHILYSAFRKYEIRYRQRRLWKAGSYTTPSYTVLLLLLAKLWKARIILYSFKHIFFFYILNFLRKIVLDMTSQILLISWGLRYLTSKDGETEDTFFFLTPVYNTCICI